MSRRRVPAIASTWRRSTSTSTTQSVTAAEEAGLPDAGNLNPEFGYESQWDSDRRLEAIESQGAVAEVLFPNGQPFQVNRLEDFGRAGNPELAAAGRQAYNRWLADFCAETPGRRAGTGGRVLRRRRPGGRGRLLGQGARPRRDHDAGAQPRRDLLLRSRARPDLGCRPGRRPARSASTAAPVSPGTARRGSRRS